MSRLLGALLMTLGLVAVSQAMFISPASAWDGDVSTSVDCYGWKAWASNVYSPETAQYNWTPGHHGTWANGDTVSGNLAITWSNSSDTDLNNPFTVSKPDDCVPPTTTTVPPPPPCPYNPELPEGHPDCVPPTTTTTQPCPYNPALPPDSPDCVPPTTTTVPPPPPCPYNPELPEGHPDCVPPTTTTAPPPTTTAPPPTTQPPTTAPPTTQPPAPPAPVTVREAYECDDTTWVHTLTNPAGVDQQVQWNIGGTPQETKTVPANGTLDVTVMMAPGDTKVVNWTSIGVTFMESYEACHVPPPPPPPPPNVPEGDLPETGGSAADTTLLVGAIAFGIGLTLTGVSSVKRRRPSTIKA